MRPLNLAEVVDYIHTNIGPQFHAKKILKITELSLDDVIKRKNPYLFRAKGSNSAHDFIKSVLDATVSSGEEMKNGWLPISTFPIPEATAKRVEVYIVGAGWARVLRATYHGYPEAGFKSEGALIPKCDVTHWQPAPELPPLPEQE